MKTDYGYFRVAAASPDVRVADVDANINYIATAASDFYGRGCRVAVFPEMCVTAYTCGDLFHQSVLLDAAAEALSRLADMSQSWPGMLIAVGAPLRLGQAVYNCAVAIASGHIAAVVPKTYLPNYNEFYEQRWFASASEATATAIRIGDSTVPFGTDILLDVDGVSIGIEICEDLWAPVPPSTNAALAGAEVILNLSASDDLIGKYSYLRGLIANQSARCISAYVYASAGFGESTTDLAFDAKDIIAENGSIIAASQRWTRRPECAVTDIDILALRRDRIHNTTFHTAAASTAPYRRISVRDAGKTDTCPALLRHINPRPFVPASDADRDARSAEIVNIQISGLAQRLKATGCRSLVVGISGGLDSTLALLVATKAFDILSIPRDGIIGVTMPGYGTTGRTHTNAVALMKALGVSIREISIVPAVEQHFADISHDPEKHDVTYENSQARERTQILMDIANQTSGMVLGTGDLSELALGWATYNGDHMSMYGVNAGVPKTLVRHLVAWFATQTDSTDERATLLDIVDTPVSPELLPASADGSIAQRTEDLVGPYELHDFFLYHTLRYGFTPRRIYLMARHAFTPEEYSDATIRKWIRIFFRRFFSQQFKRSCMPDGPKVGSVCLSPRGDWRMPSDASAALWLAQCDYL